MKRPDTYFHPLVSVFFHLSFVICDLAPDNFFLPSLQELARHLSGTLFIDRTNHL